MNASTGIPSIAGIGLSLQPRIAIQSVDGDLSPTPWNQRTQFVTASLVQMRADGLGLDEPTSLLMGNLTADASTGIADFTDLDVIIVGSGYQLKFSMLPQWKVDPIFTGVFSVKSGPAARLRILVEPSTSATTTQLLTKQPQVELTDIFGNFNKEAIATVVSVKITPVDPSAPPGWQGGLVEGGDVLSKSGLATFTNLVFYGIGAWTIDFDAELNFRPASARAAEEIILNQLASEAMQVVFAMDINNWSTDDEKELIATMALICGLDTAAFEIMDVAAGSVIVGLAFHVSDPAPYWKLASDELSNIPSALSGLGVIGLSAPGVDVEFDLPPPPPPPVPPKPYTGIPLDVVSFWTEVIQAFVISGYCVGIGMAIFSEVAASFATATRVSELANPEGEPAQGNRWHTGAGIFSGGAFRSFITHVQFIAALSSLGGRGGQPQFFFAYPYPTDRSGNWSVHDQSLIDNVRLPMGARTLAETLDWTNLRSNVTDILGDADLFPRPCDVYAQQVTTGQAMQTLYVILLLNIEFPRQSRLTHVFYFRYLLSCHVYPSRGILRKHHCTQDS